MSILIKGKTVHFDDRYLHVELEDGRIILTPMSWYKDPQRLLLIGAFFMPEGFWLPALFRSRSTSNIHCSNQINF